MRVSKITIGRLYNLGNFEHIRYEIAVDLEPGELARDTIIGLERIVAALAPENKCGVHTELELDLKQKHIDSLVQFLKEKGPDEFRQHHGYFVGTPEEYIARVQEMHREEVEKRRKYCERSDDARRLLNGLGGAADWKDCKLDWETGDDDL
jgi:hypothetical protein